MIYFGKKDAISLIIIAIGIVILFAPLFMLNEYSKEHEVSSKPESSDVVNSLCDSSEVVNPLVMNISFTKKKPSKNCSATSGNLCFSKMFHPEPISKDECNHIKFKLGIKECGYDDDAWAGAVKQCGGVKYLPSPQELAYLAEVVYKLPCGGHPKIAPDEFYSGSARFDKEAAAAVGLDSSGYLSMWSNKEVDGEVVAKPGEYAWARNFFPQNSNWYPYERYGKHNARQAVCVFRD